MDLTKEEFKFLMFLDDSPVDFHDLNIGGNSVQPISSFTNADFDFLIIATINPSTYASIKIELAVSCSAISGRSTSSRK